MPHLIQDQDRHGNKRFYVRKNVAGKMKKIRLRQKEGTTEFINEYSDALNRLKEQNEQIRASRVSQDSLEWLVSQYFASMEFLSLKEATKVDKKSTLNRVVQNAGPMKYKSITRRHIVDGRDERKDHPAAANKFVKQMRCIFEWAIENELADENPASKVKMLSMPKNSDGDIGHHVWTESEMKQFRSYHALGTAPRTAFELHAASLRASDVCQLCWQHIRDDKLIVISQIKTTEPTYVHLHEELQASLSMMENKRHLHIVLTSYDKPASRKGYAAMFKRWCRSAGLPDNCTSHGIRKASATAIAENGGSEYEIAAFLGHHGTDSAKDYTRKANQRKLAHSAHLKIQM